MATNSLKSCISSSTRLLPAVERIKIKHRFLKFTAYKLDNQETALTVRQMALVVRQSPKSAKQFIKKMGLRPIKVRMPNQCIADMVFLSAAAAFWKYLNESGRGNVLTKLGQEMLADYLK